MSETGAKAGPATGEPVPLWAIAFSYLKVALESFGGGLSAGLGRSLWKSATG